MLLIEVRYIARRVYTFVKHVYNRINNEIKIFDLRVRIWKVSNNVAKLKRRSI